MASGLKERAAHARIRPALSHRRRAMPTVANISQAFREAHCIDLGCVFDEIPLKNSVLSKLRSSPGGRRRNMPLNFAQVYPDHKEKLAVSGHLGRKSGVFHLFVHWFRVESGPPKEYPTFSSLVETISSELGDREAYVTASFSYKQDEASSIFSPIQMATEAGIFDEIIGLSGVKRNPEGKLLYRLDVFLGDKRLEHRVGFFQTVKLSEELPLGLLDIAARISNLGRRKKQ